MFAVRYADDMRTCAGPRCDNALSGRKTRYCSRSCNVAAFAVRRKRQLAQRAVDFLGGRCSACGYDRSIKALEFHHLEGKSHGIADLIRKTVTWARLVKELRLCVLLCSNCHAEEHDRSHEYNALPQSGLCHYWRCRKELKRAGVRYCGKRCSVPAAVQRRRVQMKLRAVALLGGRCSACGYQRCRGGLHFHHPGEKNANIGMLIRDNRRWSVIARELQLCELLCANCHRETHDDELDGWVSG